MNPLWIAAAAAAVLFAATSGGSSAADGATQQQMVFRDYAWILYLPAGLSNVQLQKRQSAGAPATNLQIPPPPSQAAGSGAWHVYPQGQAFAVNPQSGQVTAFPIWPNCPPGVDVYMWIPILPGGAGGGGGGGGGASVTQVNGYWIATTPWQAFVVPPGGSPQAPGSPPGAMAWTLAPGASAPPPPPGMSTGSGNWIMKHPGYLVWMTPSNGNEADAQLLAAYAQLPFAAAVVPLPAAMHAETPIAAPAATTSGLVGWMQPYPPGRAYPQFGSPRFMHHAYPHGRPSHVAARPVSAHVLGYT